MTSGSQYFHAYWWNDECNHLMAISWLSGNHMFGQTQIVIGFVMICLRIEWEEWGVESSKPKVRIYPLWGYKSCCCKCLPLVPWCKSTFWIILAALRSQNNSYTKRHVLSSPVFPLSSKCIPSPLQTLPPLVTSEASTHIPRARNHSAVVKSAMVRWQNLPRAALPPPPTDLRSLGALWTMTWWAVEKWGDEPSSSDFDVFPQQNLGFKSMDQPCFSRKNRVHLKCGFRSAIQITVTSRLFD